MIISNSSTSSEIKAHDIISITKNCNNDSSFLFEIKIKYKSVGAQSEK
jgi:hypothetical protein